MLCDMSYYDAWMISSKKAEALHIKLNNKNQLTGLQHTRELWLPFYTEVLWHG